MGMDGYDMKKNETNSALPGDNLSETSSSRGLLSWSFLGLLLTQFTVALNDNIFRWLIIPIGKARFGVMYEDYDYGAGLALTLGGMVFLLPFVLFSGYGGFFADRFSKRSVMIGCKVAEILIMAAGVGAIYLGNPWLLFVVLFAMGLQSTFYSPAKYSCIPEIVSEKNIAKANGWIGLTTMAAIILGTFLGGWLYAATTLEGTAGKHLSSAPGQHALWLSASVLLGVATLGLLTSLMVGRLRAANPQRPFSWNPVRQSFRDLGYLWNHQAILLVALGSAYYWGLASLAQTTIDKFALPELVGPNGQTEVGYLLGILTMGIGVGSFLAGWISRQGVTLKPVPFAMAGLGIFSCLLFFTPPGTGSLPSAAFTYAATLLGLLGVAAGLFDIPLLAYMQEKGEETQRGRIIAGSNFLSFTAMFLGAGAFGLFSWLGLNAREIWLAAGVVSLLVAGVAFFFVFLKLSARILLVGFLRMFYRIRLEGVENLPPEGPAVLVSNHVSYLDGIIMQMLLPLGKRIPRILYWHVFGKPPIMQKLSILYRSIPVAPGRTAVYAIRESRKALEEGDVVGIFPEGGITRHAIIMPFKPGIRHMMRGKGDVPVIPMYIGGLYGSIFSFKGTTFFGKWPERFSWRYLLHGHFRRKVTVKIGKPIYNLCDQDVRTAQRAVYDLEHDFIRNTIMKTGSETDNFNNDWIPARAVIRQWKKTIPNELAIADSTGMELTGSNALLRALIFRRLLRKHILEKDEKNVGLLIPPSVPGVLANVALTIDQRVPINLNYTVSPDILNQCIEKVGMKHLLTSRKVMEKFQFQPSCEVIYLEDYVPKVTLWDKLVCAFQAKVMPLGMLYKVLGLDKIDPDDTMTIIFTSGSTGIPKGVMLTHKNIGSNIACYANFFHIGSHDSAIGVLPFFHSFGFTGTLWTVLTRGMKGYYHYSPLEVRPIAKLCRKYRPTMLVGTPTFLRTYARRMERDDLSSVNLVVSGAERCPVALMDEYENRFGVRPIQGYGITETSPVVAANIPPSRHFSGAEPNPKDESIGFPMPGVSVKVLNLDTGELCKTGEVGMLWVSGVNIMKGYYGEPEKTAEVIKDGWYCTGDLVYQDADNFLFIAGRLSRFAKIGGEMVPHEGLEDALNKILGNKADEDLKLCVTSVPDERKGEKIIVLYTELSKTPEEIHAELLEQKYPALWIPAQDAYYQIDHIPLLGTGKLDLYAIHEKAKELTKK
ncbi:MAG: MFS transporter [Planctomycetia bacterium]|nr:MFS transporter [Planctomycetia bacterium]